MRKILAAVLLLGLLAGCSTPQKFPSVSGGSSGTAAVTEAVTEPKTDLLQNMVPVQDGSSLYVINCDAVKDLSNISDLNIFKNYLLLSSLDLPEGCGCESSSEGPVPCRIVLIDLQTGQVHAALEFETEAFIQVHTAGDYIVIGSWDDGNMTLYDENLREVSRHTIAPSWSLNNVDATGTYAYSVPESGCLLKTDLTHQTEVSLLEDSLNLSVDGLHSCGAALNYIDSTDERFHNVYLDLTTNELKELPFAGSFSYADCIDGLWLASVQDVQNMCLLGREADPFVLQSDDSYYHLVEGPAPLYTMNYRETQQQKLELYREDGSLFASCTSDVSLGFSSNPVWCESRNGYFMTARTGMGGDTVLLFWDASVPAEGEPLDLPRLSSFDWEPKEGDVVSQELYDHAARLSEQYGIEVRIADQCDTEYNRYTACPVTDYFVIDHALNALEEVLQSFPEGFVQQLQYGSMAKTQINLMGNLSATDVPPDASGFTDFAGFADSSGNRQIMVLNIVLSNLQQTIYHEFSHMIDARLEFRNRYEDTMYSELRWCSINPEDFSYTFDVYHVPDSFYYDSYDDCFIDVYSRTFPTEDRARIFENACVNNTWCFEAESHGPLREKLAYYSACIRDSFDSSGWGEETVWEKPLNGYRFDPARLSEMDAVSESRAVG